MQSSPDRWSKEWSLRACAAADFITVALEAGMDRIVKLTQGPAEVIGRAAGVEEPYITKCEF